MKPVYRFAALFMAVLLMFSAMPQAFLESAEKPAIEVSPLPSGILRGPGTGSWKVPTGDVSVKGVNPYPESPHPYLNNMDAYYSYQEPDAIGYVITFSGGTFVENGYDFIYFFDADRTQINFNVGGDIFYRFTGNQLAGRTLMIESPLFYTNLSTDDTTVKYGFRYESIIPVYPASNTTTTLYTCEQGAGNTVRLVWNKHNGADGYLVFRSTGGAADQVADVASTDCTDTLPAGCEGVTYYYKVQPYYMDGAIQKLFPESNEKIVTIMAKPLITLAYAINSTTNYIDWKTVPEADGYYLERSANAAGPFSRIKPVTASESVNGSGGSAWYYRVIPFRTYSTKVEGTACDPVLASAYAAPGGIVVEQTNTNTARIKWDVVEGATGYQVERRTATGEYALIKTLVDPASSGGKVSTTNTNLVPGTKYYYRVRAYKEVGGTRYYGSYTTAPNHVTILGRPVIKTAKRVGNTATITLTAKVTAAAGYRLYRATSSTGTYSFIKEIPGLMSLVFQDNTLVTGKTYYYKVAAYRLYGATKVIGAQSAYKKLTY